MMSRRHLANSAVCKRSNDQTKPRGVYLDVDEECLGRLSPSITFRFMYLLSWLLRVGLFQTIGVCGGDETPPFILKSVSSHLPQAGKLLIVALFVSCRRYERLPYDNISLESFAGVRWNSSAGCPERIISQDGQPFGLPFDPWNVCRVHKLPGVGFSQ